MRKFLICSILFILFKPVYSQVNIYKLENVIFGLTTIIKTNTGQGTGFFYHEYKSDTNLKYNNPIDSTLSRIWLVTNKHVIFGEEYLNSNPTFPLILEFYLRKQKSKSTTPTWDTIRLTRADLQRQLKTHAKTDVDVVTLDITPFVRTLLLDTSYIYSAVSKINFPDQKNTWHSQAFELFVGKEILSIGYPDEFYDYYNLYPTVKSGIIASKWKLPYNGKSFFLIDGKLFPGSSGSIVISKHVTFAGEHARDYDFFLFIGIYSGEYFKPKETLEFEEMTITRKTSFNTGIVWYYSVIDEIIK